MLSINDIYKKSSYYDLHRNEFPEVVIGNQNHKPPKNQYLMTDFERSIISKICSILPEDSNYLEIGSFVGWNLINVFKSNPNIHISSIDMYDLPHFNKTDNDLVYKTALTNLKEHNIFYKVQLFRGSSKSLINVLPNDSIDCCFIDGDHSYEMCLSDIIEVWPKLKSGSILFGHDSRSLGVTKAIQYIFSGNLINCPWGKQIFKFKEKYLDLSKHLNIDDINNGIWYSIKG